MKPLAHRRGSLRHAASVGTALLLVCAVSLQALAALCHCATCPTRAHDAKAASAVAPCCAAKEAAPEAAKPAHAPGVPIMATPCACGGGDHAQITAVASVSSTDHAAPLLQAAALDGAAPAVFQTAAHAVLPHESPPPLHGLARLHLSIRC